MRATVENIIVGFVCALLAGCSVQEKAEKTLEDLPGYAMGVLGEVMFASRIEDPKESFERIKKAGELYHQYAAQARANPESSAWRPWPLALGSLDVAAPARWRCSDKELPDKGVACIGSSEFGSFDAQTYISASGKAPTVQESRAIWSSIKERFDAATLVGEQESLDQAGGAAWRMSFESGEARVDIAAKTYEGGLAVGMVSNKDAAKTGQAQKARNDFLAQF